MVGTTTLAAEHNPLPDLTFKCNANGAVITTPENRTYYLGKSCDAASPGLGEGTWWYAASGFIIDVGGQSVRYNGEIPCDTIPYCLP